MVYHPFPRWLENLTILWCHYKGGIFSAVIWRPYVSVGPSSRPPAWQPGAQPTELPVCGQYNILEVLIWYQHSYIKFVSPHNHVYIPLYTHWIVIYLADNYQAAPLNKWVHTAFSGRWPFKLSTLTMKEGNGWRGGDCSSETCHRKGF